MKRRELLRGLAVLPGVAALEGVAARAARAQQPLPGPDPTLANVPYGEDPRQVLDVWRAPGNTPAPFVFFIHGGGWMNGDKNGARRTLSIAELLSSGISVVSINYRFISQAQSAGAMPPVSWPIGDAARALQFTRSRSREWNLDKTRVGACGGSAGACSSLWLALHDGRGRTRRTWLPGSRPASPVRR